MRDHETYFGKVTTSPSASVVKFTQGVNFNEGGNVGHKCDVYACFKLGTVKLTASDKIQFDIMEADNTGSGKVAVSYTAPQVDYPVGHVFKVKLPTDHKQYITAQATMTGTATTATFEGWIE